MTTRIIDGIKTLAGIIVGAFVTGNFLWFFNKIFFTPVGKYLHGNNELAMNSYSEFMLQYGALILGGIIIIGTFALGMGAAYLMMQYLRPSFMRS